MDALAHVRDLPVFVEVLQKEAVDERRLPEPGLADHHQRELEASFDRLPVHLVRQSGEADVIPIATI